MQTAEETYERRECCICSREITACFGSVIAKDFIEQKEKVRELCGLCATKLWAELTAI